MSLCCQHQHKTEEKAFWGDRREGRKFSKFAETRSGKSLTLTILHKKIQKGFRKTPVFTNSKQISLQGVFVCVHLHLKQRHEQTLAVESLLALTALKFNPQS